MAAEVREIDTILPKAASCLFYKLTPSETVVSSATTYLLLRLESLEVTGLCYCMACSAYTV